MEHGIGMFAKVSGEASFRAAIDRLSGGSNITPTALKILGSLNNRQRHQNACFYATGDLSSICYAEVGEEWSAISIDTHPNTELRYRQAAEAIIEQHFGGADVLFGRRRVVGLPAILLGYGHEALWTELASEYNFECETFRLFGYSLEKMPDDEIEKERRIHSEILEKNGLCLTEVKEGDIGLVNKCWPQTDSEEDDSYIRNLATRFPTVCARKKDTHEPVAWCLQYWSGGLAALHVLDDWRRRGLGSVIAMAQSEAMMKSMGLNRRSAHGIHAFVEEENKAGQAFFDGLPSFKRLDDMAGWFVMRPREEGRNNSEVL